jgi:hypothetical protein
MFLVRSNMVIIQMIVRELANELFDIGQDNDLINAMRLY